MNVINVPSEALFLGAAMSRFDRPLLERVAKAIDPAAAGLRFSGIW